MNVRLALRSPGLWLLALFSLFGMGCTPPTLGLRPLAPVTEPAGVVHTPRWLATPDGQHLLVQNWRPASGAPRGVLVLVHGLKDHGSRYQDFAAQMAGRGLSVHALDLRGHAHSTGMRVGIDSFGEYLDDLDRVVHDVQAIEHRSDYFLLGHSMGGAIATLYVIDRKATPRGLILSAAALEVDAPGPKVGGTKMIAALWPDAGIFQLDLDDFSRDKATVAAAKDDPMVFQGKAPALMARELIAAIQHIEKNRAQVTIPVLALHGTADRVTPPDGSKRLIAEASSTDKTLRLYDGLYHDLLHEPERAQVSTEIASWIDARLAPAPSPPAR